MPKKNRKTYRRVVVNLPLAYRDYFERGIRPANNVMAEGALDLFVDLLHHKEKLEALRRQHYGTKE